MTLHVASKEMDLVAKNPKVISNHTEKAFIFTEKHRNRFDQNNQINDQNNDSTCISNGMELVTNDFYLCIQMSVTKFLESL